MASSMDDQLGPEQLPFERKADYSLIFTELLGNPVSFAHQINNLYFDLTIALPILRKHFCRPFWIHVTIVSVKVGRNKFASFIKS